MWHFWGWVCEKGVRWCIREEGVMKICNLHWCMHREFCMCHQSWAHTGQVYRATKLLLMWYGDLGQGSGGAVSLSVHNINAGCCIQFGYSDTLSTRSQYMDCSAWEAIEIELHLISINRKDGVSTGSHGSLLHLLERLQKLFLQGSTMMRTYKRPASLSCLLTLPTTSLDFYQHLPTTGSFRWGTKWPGYEDDHSPPFSAETGAVSPLFLYDFMPCTWTTTSPP
jgi:hypothetical protein